MSGRRDVLDRWLFEPRTVHEMSAYRIALGVVLLQRFGPRLFHAAELYSSESYRVPRGLAATFDLPAPPPTVATALVAALVVALVSMTVGFRTRLSAAIAAPIMLLLVSLNAVFTCAVDDYGVLSLVLVALSPAGHAFSIDARMADRRGRPLPRIVSPWAQRLTGVLFVTTYVYAPLARLHLNGWYFFTGEPLANAFDRWQFVTAASGWTADQPWLMIPIAIGSTVGEWFIAVGLFTKRLRRFAIAFGIALHGFVLFTLLIPPGLSLLMMASYLLWLEPGTIQRLSRKGVANGAAGGQ